MSLSADVILKGVQRERLPLGERRTYDNVACEVVISTMALLTAKSVSKMRLHRRTYVKPACRLLECGRLVFSYSSRRSVTARKHIVVAKVERLGNSNKVGKVKSRNLVLV